MEFKELESINKRISPLDLYDISQISFTFNSDQLLNNFNIYYVTEFQEMRMDLVSNEIYNDTSQVSFLCNLNNIKNPLLIKKNTGIIYIDKDRISNFIIDSVDTEFLRKKISNKKKKGKIDPNRIKYLSETSLSLSPTMTKKDYDPIKYKDGKIHIGSNIFKS